MKNIVAYGLLFVVLALGAADIRAADDAPFETQNQSPLIAVYGLPALDAACVQDAGQGTVGLTLDWASQYVTAKNAQENLVLDGESLRLMVLGRYGLGRRFEVGVDIPLLLAGGGVLDEYIEGYHSLFGFPNGGREYAPKKRLLYMYEKNGVALVHMENSGQGLGDVRFAAAWQMYTDATRGVDLALRGSLKLSTGEVGSLRGSGSTDLALWISGKWARAFSLCPVSLFGAAGVLGMTKGRVLPDQQRPLVGFGALGLGIRVFSWLALKAQANAHTSFYAASDLAEVGGASAQLTVGGELYPTSRMSLAIAVTEDLVVGTAPDVVFHLSLRRTF